MQQSLLLVFARLAVADPNGLLNFLNGTQATGPLLQLWLDKQTDIFGSYERRGMINILLFLKKLIQMNDHGDDTVFIIT